MSAARSEQALVRGSDSGHPGASVRKRERPEPNARQVDRRAADGTVLGQVDLDPEWFGLETNTALMHQVVVAQLAAARSGTQSTKTRAEVAGGGAKPFRQKGMGRSRQGSIRAPQWVGGGVAFGPKPRSYRQKTPKKMVRQALRCALSDRAQLDRVVLVDDWVFDIPKTKQAVAALAALGLSGRVLVVLSEEDVVAERSFGNLPRVQTLQVGELNTYDILRNDWIVFTDSTLPGGVGDVSSHAERPEPSLEPVEPVPAKSKPVPATQTKVTEATPDEDTGADNDGADKDTAPDDDTDAVAEAVIDPDPDAVADDEDADEESADLETDLANDTDDDDEESEEDES
jgi:large subunit ribosomal protein L4